MNDKRIRKGTIMKKSTLALVGLACLMAMPPIAHARYLDGMNLYQYVGSNPTNRVDPQGLWSDKVHYTGTYNMAKDVGFSPECAKILADWDQGVDDWTGASLFTWYHFNKDVNGNPYACGRDCWFQRRWDKGVDKLKRANVYWSPWIWDVSVTDGLAHIGEALHHRQDSFAHNAKHNAETPFDHAPDVICLLWGDGLGIVHQRCIDARLNNPNWGATVNKGTPQVRGRGRPDDEGFWKDDYDATLRDTKTLLEKIWQIPAVQCHCKAKK